ncbi:MAG TPA: hypothetical protein VE136_01935 [Anaerolineales bacterium]|nr:hypothetical protein [Anaerolineales bacterium]
MNATYTHSILYRLSSKRGLLFGLMITIALLSFEAFNYSTTDFALSDLLGDLKFAGVAWATILAIAFCGIDFAGIARLFTPEQGSEEPAEVWYLFGAWLLAATMNALLTWWGVSLAVLHHETLGNAIISRDTLLRILPIFVAVMVWLIRVLIIGTISLAGERIFTQADTSSNRWGLRSSSRNLPSLSSRTPAGLSTGRAAPRPFNPQPKPEPISRPEPTYHPVSLGAAPGNDDPGAGRLRKF